MTHTIAYTIFNTRFWKQNTSPVETKRVKKKIRAKTSQTKGSQVKRLTYIYGSWCERQILALSARILEDSTLSLSPATDKLPHLGDSCPPWKVSLWPSSNAALPANQGAKLFFLPPWACQLMGTWQPVLKSGSLSHVTETSRSPTECFLWLTTVRMWCNFSSSLPIVREKVPTFCHWIQVFLA